MTFPVSQVHNVGSHTGNDTWAWDFRMPEGTAVVAALDGVVRLARGDSDEGGCDPAMARKTNYVVIESAGNIETQYLHFSAVSVTPGQYVRRGDLLGYSGKTGWACGAHLHFKVATPVSAGWNNPSVEARISGFGDPALDSWISSPPCTAPLEVASPQPPPAVRQADPGAHSAGDVQPAALSAAGSAGEAAISVAGPSTPETRTAASGLPSGAAVPRSSAPPIEHPLSSGGSSFPPPTPPAAEAGPLGLRTALPAPPNVASPAPGTPAAPVVPHDTEAALLAGPEPAPVHR